MEYLSPLSHLHDDCEVYWELVIAARFFIIAVYCCHWCTGIAVWAGHSAKVEACKDCSSMFQLPWDNPRRTEGKKRREIAGKRKRPKRERRLTFCCDFIPQFRNWMHALLMIGLHILWTSRCFSFTDWLILAMIDFSSTCVSLQLNAYCNSVVMSTAAPLQKSKRAKAKKKKEALKIIRRKLEDVAEVHTHTDTYIIYICMYVYYTHLIYSPGLWTVESSATAIPQSSPVH